MQVGQKFNPYKIFTGSFIPNILMKYRGLSGGAKLVWARLAQFSGEKGVCFPAIDTIADEVGIEKRQCIRYLSELEKFNFIEIIRPEGENKLKHLTNKYYFLWHDIFNDTSGGVINDTQRESVLRESVLRESHTQKEESVCDDEIKKIKSTKTFQNSDTGVIENIVKKKGKEAVIAAEYIEKAFSNQAVRNPAGLLISTLQKGLYCELAAGSGINGIKADIERLNERYKGFAVFKGESIKEILNIGGQIAFHTDNCLREIVLTTAKSYEEFENYLNKREAINNTS